MEFQKNTEIFIHIFNGEGAKLPSGVFYDLEKAIKWIEKYSLSGILSSFPLDTGLYDWAIENGYFEVKRDNQKEKSFIEKFTSASIEHLHFIDGKED